MNWLTNLVRPGLLAVLSGVKRDIPDDLWTKCPSCEQMLYVPGLKETLHVCQHCNHHLRMGLKERFDMLFDGDYERISIPEVQHDPLKFRDLKTYGARLKDYQNKTGEQDSIAIALGKLGKRETIICVMNFTFMGGSMGMAMGEGFIKASEIALEKRAPMLVVTASGGARMQEGILSLMQMPRTAAMVLCLREARLPYIVLLTDPTTGGVSASFAMLGDIHLAEPGAQIGFAGKRVIKQTTGEDLPEGFQTAEFLELHGIVDRVIPRHKLKNELKSLYSFMMGNEVPLLEAS